MPRVQNSIRPDWTPFLGKSTGLRGFEPRSEAPEASVLSKLDYRPSLAERSLRIKAFRGSYQERCDREPAAATCGCRGWMLTFARTRCIRSGRTIGGRSALRGKPRLRTSGSSGALG